MEDTDFVTLNQLHELTVNEKLDYIIQKMDAVESLVNGFMAKAEPILEQVLPTVKAIENAPFFKMLVKVKG